MFPGHQSRIAVAFCGACLFSILFVDPALADLPMYLVLIATRLEYWWTIALAIAIEALAIYWLFGLSRYQSVIASTVVNIATASLIFVIYLPSMFYPMSIMNTNEKYILIGSAAIIIGTAVVDTAVELVLLKMIFRAALSVLRISGFFIANLMSAGILFVAIALGAGDGQISRQEIASVEANFEPEISFLHSVAEELPDMIETWGSGLEWRKRKRQEIIATKLRFVEVTIKSYYGQTEFIYPLVPLGDQWHPVDLSIDAAWRRGPITIYRASRSGADQTYIYIIHSIHTSSSQTSYAVEAILSAPP